MFPALVAILIIGPLVVGCAGIPKEIRQAPPGDLQLSEVRSQPEAHLGALVRWGGGIVSVDNGERETWVVVVGRPLDFSGRPKDTDQSPGRFLARFDGFLDPATYAEARELTVRGHLEVPQTRRVGDYPYLYPVLRVESSQLWEPLPKYPPGYWRHPFYDPWYDPWYPYPYWW